MNPSYLNSPMSGLGSLPAGYGNSDGSEGLPPEVAQAAAIAAQFTAARANTPEEIEARIQNLEYRKRQFPFLSVTFDNQIRKLRGRQAAMLRDRAATDRWRQLGQAGVGVSLMVGVGLLGLIIVGARRLGRK